MGGTVSVITPAFRAETTIGAAVASVIAQTYPDWEHWIISDDGVDYEKLLAAQGLADRRQKFLSSDRIGGGSTRARNIVLDALSSPYAALLDADDRMKPQKLALAMKALEDQPIVSVALDVMRPDFTTLRLVGNGRDRVLTAGEHKWVSLSMDTMVVWDRRKADGRYDTELPNMTDLDFLMRLYRTSPTSLHLGTPLHDYVKISSSMSNAAGFTERMIRSKTMLLERLRSGFYPMADPKGAEGIAAFLEISLKAETAYPDVLKDNPTALFEDTIEPMLRAARPDL
jgi:glycosyltransferase involved in cell wall biosynthesis